MYDVIVIGAGPAGIMASITAAKNNKKVLLIEKNNKIGKKLELTGGGRCNLINLKPINDFIKEIPVNNKILYSVFNCFSPQDIYDYFNNLGIKLRIEEEDRVFPISNKSSTIVEGLYNQLLINKVIIKLNEEVQSIEFNKKEVITNKDIYIADNIIIATGGLSYPITGSTGDGYKFAEKMNQHLTKLYPTNTFLLTKDILPLSGITLNNVLISFNKKKSIGSMLFTHTGISGPAVFKMSEYVYKELENNKYVTINIDLLPNYSVEELLMKLNDYNQKKDMNNFVREYLPRRLADYIVKVLDLDLKVGAISKIKKQELVKKIKNFDIKIKETGAIEQSIVTGGGIDMKYINPKTMESTINKNIYFAGEILDIHGHTGGYNITIALSTGYVAGALKKEK